MRDNICFGQCRSWHHGNGKTSCQQMTPGDWFGDGMCVCFHGVSIVEQENRGNAVSALACYYFAMGAPSFARIFCARGCFDCHYNCLSDCHYNFWHHCQLRAGVYVSLMGVLIGCRGGWLSLCQSGHQLGHQSGCQAVSMRPAIQAILRLLIYHQASRYHAGFGSAGGLVLGWLVAPALRVFEPD